jgi:hypothetical protein
MVYSHPRFLNRCFRRNNRCRRRRILRSSFNISLWPNASGSYWNKSLGYGFCGLGATIGYARQKRVYFKAALLLALATAPGAILGAYLTAVLPSTILGVAFGLLLIILSIRMFFTTKYFRPNKKADKAANVTCEAECFQQSMLCSSS